MMSLLLNKFHQMVNKQAFNPTFLGIFFNPWYIARSRLWNNMEDFSLDIKGGKLLDIGCGQKPYEDLFKVDEYIGIEIKTVNEIKTYTKADIFYDGKNIPFENEKFDSFICNEVLEHVFNPDEFLKELYRVLKKDALGIFTLPFVWDEHEQPYDYARYSSFGIKHLLENNNFKIIKFKKTCNDITTIGQLLIAYIYKLFLSKKYSNLRLLVVLGFSSIINIVFLSLGKILPKNDDLYLDNIVLVKKNG